MRQLSFVDRDMFMRYHWGLGVGHTYTHSRKDADPTTNMGDFEDLEEEEMDSEHNCGTVSNSDREASDSDSRSDSDGSDVGQCMSYGSDEDDTLGD